MAGATAEQSLGCDTSRCLPAVKGRIPRFNHHHAANNAAKRMVRGHGKALSTLPAVARFQYLARKVCLATGTYDTSVTFSRRR